MSRVVPPGLAVWLLQRRLPDAQLEFFLGDLEERFRLDLLPRRGPAAARRWYWGQTLRALLQPWRPPRPIPAPRRSGDGPMRTLLADLRASLRLLHRAPLFASLVVLTFALGIGATSVIFSVVRPVLLQPPPFPDADRLTLVWEQERDGSQSFVGWQTFEDLQSASRSFESSAAMGGWLPTLSGAEPERISGQRVSHTFFHTLGIRPSLGRDFLPEEDHAGAGRVAILSHGLWQQRFGGDSAIIGRTISLDENPVTVIGVLPQSFESVLSPASRIWSPLRYEAGQSWACRSCRHLRMIARLKPGVSLAAAEAELRPLFQVMTSAHAEDYSSTGFVLTTFHQYLARNVRPAYLALLGAVTLLLLIACVNVTNLFLGRAVDRSREFALRAALGAGRGAVVRQLVTEAVVLALVGGGLGVLLALGGVDFLRRLAPSGLPRLDRVQLDGAVLLFAFGLTLVTGLLAGLAPAIMTSRSNPASLIREGARGLAGSRGHRLRRGLVAVAVAIAIMLLTGTGLLARSLGRLLAEDPGFDPAGLLTVELDASGSRYPDDAAVHNFYEQLVQAVTALPGVRAATVVNQLLLSGDFDSWGVHLESRPSPNPANDPSAFRFTVGPNYIGTLGIPLVQGRDFGPEDGADAPKVALINQVIARRDFAGLDPIGQRVKLGGMDGPWLTVVGVVGDVRHQGLDAAGERQIYLPARQAPWAYSRMMLVLRATGDAAGLAPAVRRTVHAMDPGVPLARVATMAGLVRATTAQRRFALLVFETFAAVALVLAGAGLYGVIAASVSERTREIGIRSALGASRQRILRLVLGQGLGLIAVGLVFGIGGGLALARLIRSLLYGVSPADPVTLVTVSALLAGVAALACWLPARRAVQVDPVIAMRE